MTKSPAPHRFKWFTDARFGIFFHWGIYSAYARGEWALYFERTPFGEYKKLADRFRPKKGWADEWMKLVKRSGAGYTVLTTKHHDGYCLFDTKTSSDYSAPTTAPGRDLIAEYVKACRKYRIKIGFYYSPPDWRYGFKWNIAGPMAKPKIYKEYKSIILTQIEELCRNYGKIDLWWWDGAPPDVKRTVARMRRWQPGMMINDRCGLKLDCGSQEGCTRINCDDPKHSWEQCMTSNAHWGYFGPGDIRWITVTGAIHNLVSDVSYGGNLLLNIGPTASGDIPIRARMLFEGIGKWLRKNGESIYGKGASSISGGAAGVTTAGDTKAYLHILHYVYPEYVVLSPKVKVESAKVLATGKDLGVRREGKRVIISGLPRRAPSRDDTVIVLETAGSSEK